ncbi:MAG TPA: biotin-dependent carboxyltransferase family protein [Opitutaceae bacterium]
MRVVRAGMFTTVQDRGRPAYRNAGVPLGGAMDTFALRVGNLLVGNDEGAAGLEVTLSGAEFQFPKGAVVAVTGAHYEGVPSWKPLALAPGQSLRLGDCQKGARGYVAVRGGIAVAPILGSRSTYQRGGWGGFEGRRLQDGDLLALDAAAVGTVPAISAAWSLLPPYSNAPVLRYVAGAQADWFGDGLSSGEFQVEPNSDRMGIRLGGGKVTAARAWELVSSGVVPGTIQVPPDGHPIVLGADAQTIGGYPQAGHVVAVDLPLAAQLRPGDRATFRAITLAEAQWLALQREQDLGLLRAGLRAR